jgi:hypothetical protein
VFLARLFLQLVHHNGWKAINLQLRETISSYTYILAKSVQRIAVVEIIVSKSQGAGVSETCWKK